MNGVWAGFCIGAALLGLTVWAGWIAGGRPQWPPVQAVDWWVRRIALPILRPRSWLGRAAIIFGNNIAILTLLVAAGSWPGASLVGVALVGLSLGAAFRLLLSMPDHTLAPRLRLEPRDERRVRIGLALNMLEPPAILYAVTLSISRWLVPLPSEAVWRSYLIWVVPAMLIAAGGEALWLGAGRDRTGAADPAEPTRNGT
jgi:hypothetical protein